mmetsp:Transcript_17443/g.33567  ORF Transcript_17443/g.33567 Transcript_17443/m.33567 type:complete len:121 (-) Transcript_17443:83-445(-)
MRLVRTAEGLLRQAATVLMDAAAYKTGPVGKVGEPSSAMDTDSGAARVPRRRRKKKEKKVDTAMEGPCGEHVADANGTDMQQRTQQQQDLVTSTAGVPMHSLLWWTILHLPMPQACKLLD